MARILIIDDDALVRTQHQAVLATAGHATEAAATIGEATSLLTYQHYDLLLCDLQLPDGLGTQLLCQGVIRRRQTQLLLVSGAAEQVDPGVRGMPGLAAILSKPLSAAALEQAVADALTNSAPMATQYPRLITPDERDRLLDARDTRWLP